MELMRLVRGQLTNDHNGRDDQAGRRRDSGPCAEVVAQLGWIHADVAEGSACCRPARKVPVIRLIEPVLRHVRQDESAKRHVQEEEQGNETLDGDGSEQGRLGDEELLQDGRFHLQHVQSDSANEDLHNGHDEGVSIVPADAEFHAIGGGAQIHRVIGQEQRRNQHHH